MARYSQRENDGYDTIYRAITNGKLAAALCCALQE